MKLPSMGIGVMRRGGVVGASRVWSQGVAPSFWCEQLCFLKKQDCYFYCTLIGGPSSCYDDCQDKYTQCVADCP